MQSSGCKPLSYDNPRREYAELDQQIAECKEEADWLVMFRLLLWKGQLQQVVCFTA